MGTSLRKGWVWDVKGAGFFKSLSACLQSLVAVSSLSCDGAMDSSVDIFNASYHLDLGLTFKDTLVN